MRQTKVLHLVIVSLLLYVMHCIKSLARCILACMWLAEARSDRLQFVSDRTKTRRNMQI